MQKYAFTRLTHLESFYAIFVCFKLEEMDMKFIYAHLDNERRTTWSLILLLTYISSTYFFYVFFSII